MSLHSDNDPMGRAIHDFHLEGQPADIVVHSDVADPDTIPVAFLFRPEAQMPELELLALDECRGHILDVGAAAGPHALALQQRGLRVTALEQSQLAVAVMHQRGVHKAEMGDIFSWKGSYDTILLLMNGLGIARNLEGLAELFAQFDKLLTPTGQVLLDSCDISPLFEEEDGSQRLDLNRDYPGIVTYEMEYGGIRSAPFSWLFMAFDDLHDAAQTAGFRATLIADNDDLRYLARLERA